MTNRSKMDAKSSLWRAHTTLVIIGVSAALIAASGSAHAQPQFGDITALHSGGCISVDGSSSAVGARIVQADCSGADNEDFSLEAVAGNYRIRARHSNLCIGVNGGDERAGAAIAQIACDDADHALWTATPADGAFALQMVHTGYCLDVAGGSAAAGATYVQWPCKSPTNGSRFNQRFEILVDVSDTPSEPADPVDPPADPVEPTEPDDPVTPVPSGSARTLVAGHSDKCVRLSSPSDGVGDAVVQSDCGDATTDHFLVDALDGEFFQIRAQSSDLCLGVAESSTAGAAAISQLLCSGADNVVWSSVPSADGQQLKVRHSQQCMDVSAGSTRNGAGIIQWPCKDPGSGGSANQRFTLSLVSPPDGGQDPSDGEGDTGDAPADGGDNPGDTGDMPADGGDNPGDTGDAPADGGDNPGDTGDAPADGGDNPGDTGDAPSDGGDTVDGTGPGAASDRVIGSFTTVGSRKCVVIENGSRAEGALAVQFDCAEVAERNFVFEKFGGAFQIRSVASDLCLSVEGASTVRGMSVVQSACAQADHQLWTIVGDPMMAQLRVAHTGLCMDVFAGSQADNTRLTQWDCKELTEGTVSNQQFSLPIGFGGVSRWDGPYSMPTVPVAAANLPDGRILTWSAGPDRFSFSGSGTGRTYTSIYDPADSSVTDVLVSETGHDMFCPGLNVLPDGRVLVNGGSDAGATSIFDPTTDRWTASDPMAAPRAYQGNTLLPDGSVLTVGGSWAGGRYDRASEIWTDGSWRTANGLNAAPLDTTDQQGQYREDNHMFLFTASNGLVFHAGPSPRMHWLDADGDGTIIYEGERAGAGDQMIGNAVMYDVDKILVLGGAEDYERTLATNRAFVVDVSGGVGGVVSREVQSMAFERGFQNSVVLPTGHVVVVGGQAMPIPFTDSTAVLVPEIWDPISETFSSYAPMLVPRTYHSTALLMEDGRVWVGGGGLCGGCNTNHADFEIFTPPYLLTEDGGPRSRPTIDIAPALATFGQTITVGTSGGVESFALIRTSSTTHGLNNDQRRIPLQATNNGGGAFSVQIPGNPAVVIPGNYFLFALKADGTPSVAELLTIR